MHLHLPAKLTVVLLSLTFLMLSCQKDGSSTPEPSQGDVKFSDAAAFALTGALSTDCSFDGQTILDGGTVTAYQNSSVPFGDSCQAEVRTCTEGFLSGSFNYSSCSVDAANGCLFNGQTVAHGSSVEAYNLSSVGLGGECIGEMRTCDNGALSGSYQYASCSINLPTSCLFNGQTIASGGSVGAYLSSSVSYGELCSVEIRYCVDGTLSGSNQYASCAVNEPASCLFNGQTIAHGQTLNAFLNSSVGYGDSCQIEVRTCNNGVLSGVNQYASCVVDEPASCLFNGVTVAHGATVTAYLSSNAAAGELCDAEERVCENGHLGGSYAFASCSIDQPASCLFNGETVASGASVIAFKSSRVEFGGACNSEVRKCSDGVLSGSAAYASCQADSPAACLFNGQTIAHGQTVIGYQSGTVLGEVQCSSEVKTCTNGGLSGSFTYSSCTTINDDNDDNDDEDDDKNKEKYCKKQRVEKKHHERMSRQDQNGQHSDNGLHLGWYKHKHKEHFDCGKHLGWYKEKKKKKSNCSQKNDKQHSRQK